MGGGETQVGFLPDTDSMERKLILEYLRLHKFMYTSNNLFFEPIYSV